MEKKNLHFTPREKDIMSLLMIGLTNKEIAEKLIVTIHTVKVYIEQIYEKTSCHNRVQLVIYILRNGILELPKNE